MKNVIRKKDFWGIMFVVFLFLGLIYLVLGLPLTFLLIAMEWVLLMSIFSIFRAFKRRGVKAVNQQAAAFVKGHFIKLSDTDNSRFNAIVNRGKPYLAIAKSKWVIGLFLLLATVFCFFRSVDISFTHPVYGGTEVISFYVIASTLAWIVFSSMVLVMWLAARLPRICYERASFYALPAKEEEREDIEVIKGHEGKMIVKQENGCLLSSYRLALIMIENKESIPTGRLETGDVLCLGDKPVLSNKEMEEGEVQKDFLKEKKSIVFY